MEREGSGIDLLFERLLATGRKVPTITEGTDSVHVAIPRRVMQPGVIKLLVEADKRYQLTERERITFALVAQTESIRHEIAEHREQNLLLALEVRTMPELKRAASAISATETPS